ncbi:C2H2 zinc finger [Ceratobasidium sp. AG-Ba]|nr:C2H2 zinc finger [Ceratobasidium sp. AG-Ba]
MDSDILAARRLHTTRTQRNAPPGPYAALSNTLLGFYTAPAAQSSPLPSHSLPLISGHWPLSDCPPDCHEPFPCLDSCAIPAKDCDRETCPDPNVEHIVWVAPEWHAHCNPPPQFAMNNELGDDLQRLFDCCPNTYYPQNDCCIPLPGSDGTTTNVDQQTAHAAGFAALFKSFHPASPTTHSLSSQSLSTQPTPELSSLDYFPRGPSTSVPSSSAAAFPCRWGNCGQCFASLGELVGHVNLAHLRLPSADPQHDHAHGAPACHIAPPESLAAPQTTSQETLACPWSNCSVVPAPMNSNTDLNASLCALASHLFHDHLQLPVQNVPGVELPFSLPSPVLSTTASAPTTGLSPASPLTPASPSLSAPGSSLTAATTNPVCPDSAKGKDKAPDNLAAPNTHTCGWIGCGQTFDTCADLTEHLSAVHVGRGKASYDCHWAGCARNGPKYGFSSKQKVLRHLQSHTGHRPFKCEVCGLDFSEAATLQQHMRRHTQEKPYVCDFPGCGKAFAITGALTIHKRTHNGDKPFKCKYCDRAFSESSNLSKHLRTHTGIRPYACTEPGCDKKFSRPDQVARHMSVHRKKDKDKDKDKEPSEEKDDEEMDVEGVEG